MIILRQLMTLPSYARAVASSCRPCLTSSSIASWWTIITTTKCMKMSMVWLISKRFPNWHRLVTVTRSICYTRRSLSVVWGKLARAAVNNFRSLTRWDIIMRINHLQAGTGSASACTAAVFLPPGSYSSSTLCFSFAYISAVNAKMLPKSTIPSAVCLPYKCNWMRAKVARRRATAREAPVRPTRARKSVYIMLSDSTKMRSILPNKMTEESKTTWLKTTSNSRQWTRSLRQNRNKPKVQPLTLRCRNDHTHTLIAIHHRLTGTSIKSRRTGSMRD